MKTSPHTVRAAALDTEDDDLRLLDPDSRVLFFCRKAYDSEQRGEYEAAFQDLSEWFTEGSLWPRSEGLGLFAEGELRLRVGINVGCIGSVKQIPGAQAHAKKLISGSMRFFREAGCVWKVGEALAQLGRCYRREGNFDRARDVMGRARRALVKAPEAHEARVVATLYAAIIEHEAGRLTEAYDLLRESESDFHFCGNDVLLGKFHDNLGLIFYKFSVGCDGTDDRGRALIEFAGASEFFRKAGSDRLRALTENNCGLMSLELGMYDESAEHIGIALALARELGDKGHEAEATESWAQWHLARGGNKEAAHFARRAAQVFRKGERPASLAGALTTLGVALARLGEFGKARKELGRAFQVAEKAGAYEQAGMAALAAFEESHGRLPFADRIKIYLHARSRLGGTQSARTRKRLDEAASEIAEAALARESASASPSDEKREAAAIGHSAALITGDSAEERLLLARRAHEQSGHRGPFITFNYNPLKGGEDDEDASYEPEDFVRYARQAAGGTLFVDEVQDLSSEQLEQLRLLLDERVIEHAGAPGQRERVKVRVIVGTSADLSAEVDDECFPVALYKRLCAHASQDDSAAAATPSTLFDERAAAEDVSLEQSMKQHEVELIRRALRKAGGHPAGAARLLRTERSTLEYKIFIKYPEELRRYLAPTVRRGRDAAPASPTGRRGRRPSTRGGREGACSTTKGTRKK